jgi:hypothetical protein
VDPILLDLGLGYAFIGSDRYSSRDLSNCYDMGSRKW